MKLKKLLITATIALGIMASTAFAGTCIFYEDGTYECWVCDDNGENCKKHEGKWKEK
ncbi:hypothetical protein [Kangiella sp. TOML190]|uniref:hypothetical protein n=1 Tax=Kangiella sp. TOML190 TaxID=2931351 RepID=UPI00203FC65B|nr:hypothetical protein [Kangiella sp. TOML190]